MKIYIFVLLILLSTFLHTVKRIRVKLHIVFSLPKSEINKLVENSLDVCIHPIIEEVVATKIFTQRFSQGYSLAILSVRTTAVECPISTVIRCILSGGGGDRWFSAQPLKHARPSRRVYITFRRVSRYLPYV